jgi:hypothetical protein
MRTTNIIWMLVIGALAVAVVLWLIPFFPADASAFASTTNVVFMARLPPLVAVAGTTNDFTSPSGAPLEDVPLAVSDPDAVQRLVAAVRLRRKPECTCGPHRFQAVFQTSAGQIPVSFCRHCFDVLDARAPSGSPYDGARFFKMPNDFYAQFRSHVQQQTNIQWRLLPL